MNRTSVNDKLCGTSVSNKHLKLSVFIIVTGFFFIFHNSRRNEKMYLILDQMCYRNVGIHPKSSGVSQEKYDIFASTLNFK